MLTVGTLCCIYSFLPYLIKVKHTHVQSINGGLTYITANTTGLFCDQMVEYIGSTQGLTAGEWRAFL